MNNLIEYASEALGSFVFFATVLSRSEATFIAAGLFVAILIASVASKAHLNPAVSFMKFLDNSIDSTQLGGYIIAQLVGAVLAVRWMSSFGKSRA